MFNCKICNKSFNRVNIHLEEIHGLTKEEYYKKYINESSGKCLLCGISLKFNTINNPYKKCCSVCNRPKTLEQHIFVYGEDGKTIWEKSNEKRKKSNSKQGLIEKYGEDYYNTVLSPKFNGQLVIHQKRLDPEYNKFYLSRQPTRIEYYLEKGFSENEAKEIISKNQKTFSLDKCIEKYGEEGKLIWEARQKKWQDTLNSKSDEEKLEINIKKTRRCGSNKGLSVSNKETKFLNLLETLFNITIERSFVIVDENSNDIKIFDGKYKNILFEYNGDYWHCNPKKYDSEYFNKSVKLTASQIWEKDALKAKVAIDKGYILITVWENDMEDLSILPDEIKRIEGIINENKNINI